jgi:hypothetical protein
MRRRPLQLEALEDRYLLAGNLTAHSVPFSVVEGTTFTGPVATFTDSDPGAAPGDFTATIDWGDHITSNGTVTGNGSGSFTVNGSHTYVDNGNFTVGVQIKDKDGTSAQVDSPGTIMDAPIVATGIPVTAVAGKAFTAPVASFTTGDPNASAGDFAATIDWGDGHLSTGTISPSLGGGFNVSGGNTYARPGSYDISITITSTGGSTAAADSTATVTNSPLSLDGLPVEAVEGKPFAAAVARLTSDNPHATPDDFTATIDWGDGQITSGTVVPHLGGGFDVVGTHTYSDDKNFTIQVTVQDSSASVSTSTNATVADAPLLGQGVNFNVQQGRAVNNGMVATFTDTGGAEPVGNYTATIDWGDGTAAGQGVITVNAGQFTVTGSHTYTSLGTFSVKTTIRDAGGAMVAVTSNAAIGSQNARFIAAVYRDLLGREPDAGGLAHFSDLLDRGVVTRPQLVRLIENSLEYRMKVVRDLYRSLLGREADPTGLNLFVGFLASGGTALQLRAILIGSPEYYARAGGTILGFLTAVYRDVLGRGVDPVGRDFFGQLLRAGVSRTSVALLILTSTEGYMRLVRGMYQTYLHRDADPGGLNNFVNRLQRGASEEDIRADIMGSDEYFQHV